MVYTYLTGRIGNNLFQLATAAALAKRNNTGFAGCITDTWCNEPDNCYLDEYLKQFQNTILRNVTLVKGKPGFATVFDQVEKLELIPYFENICLHGLWQSEQYFVDERQFILDLFEIDEATEKFIAEKYHEVFKDEVISIVVRRGDYCKQPQFHPTCSMAYYKSAINYFGRNKRFLIISDDIEWCKTKFKGENFYFANHDSPTIDFYLQTKCTHNIISNSSFAWWGAWLNQNPYKTVMAPKENWCGYFYKDFCKSNLLPETWVKIPNPMILKHRIKVVYAILITFCILPVKHFFERKIKKLF